MTQTVLVTGSTDGVGLAAARRLAASGVAVLLHGRNADKLAAAADAMAAEGRPAAATYVADLSRLAEAAGLAASVARDHARLDALVNNAGVFTASSPRTSDGLDMRFAVNAIAPFILTTGLSPRLGGTGRVVNLSSAAQAPVDLDCLRGARGPADDMAAYAQSKLALTMWSRVLGAARAPNAPSVIAVNPGSLLASKMVRDAFGVAGRDIGAGADIVARAAVDPAFADASGLYFDGDAGDFGPPHPDALNDAKSAAVMGAIEAVIARLGLD